MHIINIGLHGKKKKKKEKQYQSSKLKEQGNLNISVLFAPSCTHL